MWGEQGFMDLYSVNTLFVVRKRNNSYSTMAISMFAVYETWIWSMVAHPP